MSFAPRRTLALKSLVVDAGVLIEIAYATKLGEAAARVIEESPSYTTPYAITELFYVLCRRFSSEFAEEKVTLLLESNYVKVEHSSELCLEAGKIKCERRISLADCYIIALAKMLAGKAMFARREREIQKESDRKPFDVEIIYAEDLI